MTRLSVKTAGGVYDVISERGGLQNISKIWELDRKVMIVTDDGVPSQYAEMAASRCKSSFTLTLPQGEATKSVKSLLLLWERMAEEKMTRTDAVMAVGGGVVGDLAGFAAATYMRGIDFYNVPTTVLSQVDSSVGGKTAVDFAGYKNIVGAFWQPRGVMLDSSLLETLPERQISNGLSEAVKMAATLDGELFRFIEENGARENLEEVIVRAVGIKKRVVEADEREAGLRKVLNFGHTVAHALESRLAFDTMYHGECVAVGMMCMCSGDTRRRLGAVLDRLSLPTVLPCGAGELTEAVFHDKKASGGDITVVTCPSIGSYEMKNIPIGDFEKFLS